MPEGNVFTLAAWPTIKFPARKRRNLPPVPPESGNASDSEPQTAAGPSPSPAARAGDEPSNQLSKKTIGRLIRVPLTSPKAWIFILVWSIPAVSIAAYFALPSVKHLVDTVLGGFWLVTSVEIPAHFFTTGATLIVAVVAWRALKQKQAADRKSEWWRRTQYALDQLVSGNAKSNFLGTDLIEFLARDHDDNPELVDEADRILFKEVVERLPMLISSEDKMEKNVKEEKT